MRNREHMLDYQHIKTWGKLQGWTDNLIESQQWLAYRHNAPWDTVELVNGKAMRFQDLTKAQKEGFKQLLNRE